MTKEELFMKAVEKEMKNHLKLLLERIREENPMLRYINIPDAEDPEDDV